MIGHIEYMMKRLKEEQANMQSDNLELDMVNSPAHYNKANIETIDMIESVTGDGFEAYLQGNILKYICRYKNKNKDEDLEKIIHYVQLLKRRL